MSEYKAHRTALSRCVLIGMATAAPIITNAGGLMLTDDLVVRCMTFLAVD